MNVSLPAQLKAFVEQKTAEEGYSTPSEYVRELIRRDQRARKQAELEAQLLEGLASPSIRTTQKFWGELRATARQQGTRIRATKPPRAR